MVMVRDMVMKIGDSKEGSQGGHLPKLRHIISLQKEGLPIEAYQLEGLLVNKGVVMEVVEIKVIRIRKSIGIPSMT